MDRVSAFRMRSGTLASHGVVWAIAVFLLLPTLLVVAISFTDKNFIQFPPGQPSLRWYRSFFEDQRWTAATLMSIKVAIGTMISATVIGTLAALAFVRGTLPGGEFLRVVSLSPLIAPGIVTAVAVYLVFAPLHLTGTYIGFVLAHTMLAAPYVVLVMSASLQSFDADIELAALSCGASRARAFFEVVLPNILPGLLSAAIFAFLTSFDEVTVAIFISAADQVTLPSKLFEDINNTLTPVIASASAIMVLLSLALMATFAVVRFIFVRGFARKQAP